MDNVRKHQYGRVSEELVFEYLVEKEKHKDVEYIKQKARNFGDIKIEKNKKISKIIEVKGLKTDNNSDTTYDWVTKYVTLSKNEYDFLVENPDKFEVCIVYRLRHDRNPNWNKAKIARIDGRKLIECKTSTTVRLATPQSFWKDIDQINLNKTKYVPKKKYFRKSKNS